MHSFEQTVSLLLHHLPHTSLQKHQLTQIAKKLPQIDRGGFEFHFANNRIDVQQCILYSDEAWSPLGIFCAKNNWNKVSHFLNLWQQNIKQDIDNIWFELDSDLPIAQITPCLFCDIKSKILSKSERKKIITNVLDSLAVVRTPKQQQNIEKCIDLCPVDCRVTYVGAMLSRKNRAVRLNVCGLNASTVVSYLHEIGWSGDGHAVQNLFEWSLAFVDGVTLAIDVGEEVLPQLALECLFDTQVSNKWEIWLNELVKKQLCTSLHCDQILSWPGMTTPQDLPTWPQHLIFESMYKPRDVFSSFVRKLSHIKLSYRPHKPIVAKGYLWFNHVWLKA